MPVLSASNNRGGIINKDCISAVLVNDPVLELHFFIRLTTVS